MSDSGKPEEVLVIARNITERKKAEEKEEFLHSLLRHDVRNKAQVVQGYHELLKDYDLPGEAEEYVERANKTVQDSIDLIEKVRTLRKISEKDEIGEVNVGMTIKNVVSENEP
ncbi:hypothetical protein AKJ51_05230, partial [candidate division MSBL1 archaeon SCGC-AAA382A20]